MPWAGVLAAITLVLSVAQVPALIVILPAIGYIWSSGNYGNGAAIAYTIILLLSGMADNVLKPLMLGRGVDAPMPVILLGALGGMATGGILGMFVGATLLALGYQIFMGWVAGEAGASRSHVRPSPEARLTSPPWRAYNGRIRRTIDAALSPGWRGFFVLSALSALSAIPDPASAVIVTNASDTYRTGWYPDQASLTPALVAGPGFMQRFATPIQGQIYAQPLVANNTLFVATEINWISGSTRGRGRSCGPGRSAHPGTRTISGAATSRPGSASPARR